MNDLGFQLRGKAGRFCCHACDAHLDVPLCSPMNPEKMAKAARAKGWQASAHHGRSYCPECLKPKPNDPDSELKKVIPMPASAQSSTASAASAPIPLRDPTPDQKFKIRGYLDKSFDEEKGMYLDGLSDDKIAESVGVPRACVERIREMGWGPIKVDPVMVGLRAELDQLKRDIEKHRTALQALEAKSMNLGSRIERSMGKVG